MTEPADSSHTPPAEEVVHLKNPGLAALLAWLWPGAGHLYQGRTAKGILFMVCVLGTYFYGFALGEGHVVYASWRKIDRRLPYLCQVGVGLPALPALVQTMGDKPLFGEFMKQPQVLPGWQVGTEADELSKWHASAGIMFEFGTLYTMVAGLLNILAIYDAFAGPVFPKDEKDRTPPDDDDKDAPDKDEKA
jgi:hypothetical protein